MNSIPASKTGGLPYRVAPMPAETALLALRGLVETYLELDHLAVTVPKKDENTLDWLFRCGDHERRVGNLLASSLRAIHAIHPDVAQELREISSIQLGTLQGRAMQKYRIRRIATRLGIDLKRRDSEFDVLPELEAIIYPDATPEELAQYDEEFSATTKEGEDG